MADHEITIEIRKTGEVKVVIQGANGREVHDYIDFFRKTVGKVKEQHIPHQTYEPPSPVHLDIKGDQQIRNIEW